jgi:hypothetical protein
MADVDLNFIARQCDRLTSDISTLRDDINVLSAMVLAARRRHCCMTLTGCAS